MSDPETVELTLSNLDKLTAEVRTDKGAGEYTKEFNRKLIEVFRANSGQLSGEFARAPIILVTMIGSKSGKERTVPLGFVDVEGRVLIIASRGGTEENPVWYSNITANPLVTVELGAETYRAEAIVIEGQERDRLYALCGAKIPAFLDYQKRTTRKIPVIELRRLN